MESPFKFAMGERVRVYVNGKWMTGRIQFRQEKIDKEIIYGVGIKRGNVWVPESGIEVIL